MNDCLLWPRCHGGLLPASPFFYQSWSFESHFKLPWLWPNRPNELCCFVEKWRKQLYYEAQTRTSDTINRIDVDRWRGKVILECIACRSQQVSVYWNFKSWKCFVVSILGLVFLPCTLSSSCLCFRSLFFFGRKLSKFHHVINSYLSVSITKQSNLTSQSLTLWLLNDISFVWSLRFFF